MKYSVLVSVYDKFKCLKLKIIKYLWNKYNLFDPGGWQNKGVHTSQTVMALAYL